MNLISFHLSYEGNTEAGLFDAWDCATELTKDFLQLLCKSTGWKKSLVVA